MNRRRFESLRTRRRRARRRCLFVLGSLIVALAAAGSLGLQNSIGVANAGARRELPDVATAPRAEAPEPAPLAPAEILATLPPTVRVGSEAWPRLLAQHAGAPFRERVELSTEMAGVKGPLEVEYTLDPVMTAQVAALLRRDHVELAHVIVMDPVDGRVLAYASTAPREFPATRPYPTASLMKVVTASAVLQQAPEAKARPCRFRGSPYYLAANLLDPPQRGHVSSFEHALAISNNQCFAQFAVNELGSLAVVDQMERLGLLEAPGPGHAPGEVDPVVDRLALGKLGSGLAGSRISPLAAVRLAATVVDGNVVSPRWIARVTDARGSVLRLPAAPEPRPALAPAVSTELRSMMVETTLSGTARRAFRGRDGKPLLGPVRVAGKTGSLSGKNPDGHYGWFIGVAPAHAPELAIATLVVNRAKRRVSASQVAAGVLESVFCGDGSCLTPAANETLSVRHERADRG